MRVLPRVFALFVAAMAPAVAQNPAPQPTSDAQVTARIEREGEKQFLYVGNESNPTWVEVSLEVSYVDQRTNLRQQKWGGITKLAPRHAYREELSPLPNAGPYEARVISARALAPVATAPRKVPATPIAKVEAVVNPSGAGRSQVGHGQGASRIAREPASLPDGVTARHAQTGKISGPVCHEGGVVDGSLYVERFDSGRRTRIVLDASVANDCLTDTIQGRVTAKLRLKGRVVSTLTATTEDCPGRGWPWNGTVRRGGGHHVIEVVGELSFDSVEWVIENTHYSG